MQLQITGLKFINQVWGKKRTASLAGSKRFLDLTLDYLEHSIKHNQREDGLFHAIT